MQSWEAGKLLYALIILFAYVIINCFSIATKFTAIIKSFTVMNNDTKLPPMHIKSFKTSGREKYTLIRIGLT